MIRISEKFKEFVEWHGNVAQLSRQVGVHHKTLFNLLDKKQPSLKAVEGIIRFTGWKFEDLFDIVPNKVPNKRRMDDGRI